jgi:hypothetical protein
VPVEYLDLDGETLALGDECVDHTLVTWTLCTIPDVARALARCTGSCVLAATCISSSTAALRTRV